MTDSVLDAVKQEVSERDIVTHERLFRLQL